MTKQQLIWKTLSEGVIPHAEAGLGVYQNWEFKSASYKEGAPEPNRAESVGNLQEEIESLRKGSGRPVGPIAVAFAKAPDETLEGIRRSAQSRVYRGIARVVILGLVFLFGLVIALWRALTSGTDLTTIFGGGVSLGTLITWFVNKPLTHLDEAEAARDRLLVRLGLYELEVRNCFVQHPSDEPREFGARVQCLVPLTEAFVKALEPIRPTPGTAD
jgi:hypothetical protein